MTRYAGILLVVLALGSPGAAQTATPGAREPRPTAPMQLPEEPGAGEQTPPTSQPDPASEGEEASTLLEQTEVGPRNRSPEEDRPLAQSDGLSQAGDWVQTILALLAVISLVFAARWLLKRRQGAAGGASAQQAVEVLSRTAVSARQSVLLVRVGQRVLVVGTGSDGMSTLAQIDDSEEVAAILGTVESAKANSLAGGFNRMLQNLQGQDDASGRYEPVEPVAQRTPAASAAAQMRTMLHRIRNGAGGRR